MPVDPIRSNWGPKRTYGLPRLSFGQPYAALVQLFLGVIAVGIVWLFATVAADVTLEQLLLPMFVMGAGFGASAQIPNIQLSTLPAKLQGEGSGFAETGKELGVGLGTAVIGSIMFGLALGGSVDAVATKMEVSLSPVQRNEIVVQLEDASFPDTAAKNRRGRCRIWKACVTQANVEAFQITLGVLTAILLAALLIASFIPRIESEDANAKSAEEAVADVSSRRT